MTNDETREGYCDGIGDTFQPRRCDDYRAGFIAGREDRWMLGQVGELRRRNAMTGVE